MCNLFQCSAKFLLTLSIMWYVVEVTISYRLISGFIIMTGIVSILIILYFFIMILKLGKKKKNNNSVDLNAKRKLWDNFCRV